MAYTSERSSHKQPLSHPPEADPGLRERVRLLSYTLLATNSIALISGLIIFPADLHQQRFWSLLLFGLGLLSSIVLYLLSSTRYARLGVYSSLIVAVCLLAAMDPLSGTLGGGTWVLFQIWPPVAALVLRESRATIFMAIVTGGILLLVALLQLNGVLAVQLTAMPHVLYFNLAMQLIVLTLLSSIIALVTEKERQAMTEALQSQEESSAQLQRVQELLDEQQRLNSDLTQSIAATQARDMQLMREQEHQQELRQTIAALSAPVVPVLPGVVAVPLVGIFDAPRLADLCTMVLRAIGQHRVRIVMLDVTGIQHMDSAVVQTLVTLISSSRLLGAEVIVVGISPESAQVLVSLDVDINLLHPMASLQEAVQYALQRLR